MAYAVQRKRAVSTFWSEPQKANTHMLTTAHAEIHLLLFLVTRQNAWRWRTSHYKPPHWPLSQPATMAATSFTAQWRLDISRLPARRDGARHGVRQSNSWNHHFSLFGHKGKSGKPRMRCTEGLRPVARRLKEFGCSGGTLNATSSRRIEKMMPSSCRKRQVAPLLKERGSPENVWKFSCSQTQFKAMLRLKIHHFASFATPPALCLGRATATHYPRMSQKKTRFSNFVNQ